jgi:outer membrane protein assembly factor BamE (lipoprotein component of BamABCDE complex)
MLILLFAIAVLAGLFLLYAWRVFSPPAPVPMRSLKMLEPGATQRTVLETLGQPTEIWTNQQTWAYYLEGRAVTVFLYFDTNGLFSGYEFDD